MYWFISSNWSADREQWSFRQVMSTGRTEVWKRGSTEKFPVVFSSLPLIWTSCSLYVTYSYFLLSGVNVKEASSHWALQEPIRAPSDLYQSLFVMVRGLWPSILCFWIMNSLWFHCYLVFSLLISVSVRVPCVMSDPVKFSCLCFSRFHCQVHVSRFLFYFDSLECLPHVSCFTFQFCFPQSRCVSFPHYPSAIIWPP